MATREEIREGILKIQRCEDGGDCPEDYEGDDPCPECRTEKLTNYLHSQGVVIKVEGKLLDTIPDLCVVNLVEGRGYPRCMAGYEAVESLIEVKDD